MSREQKLMADPGKPSKRALPAWWLVFIKEVTELWIAGKALALVFIYSVFLGIVTFVIAIGCVTIAAAGAMIRSRNHK